MNMKKFIIFAACAAMLASCGNQSKSAEDNYTLDSLQNIIEQKDSELGDLMDSFAAIQEGFDLIDAEEGEVQTLRSSGEGNSNANDIKEKMAHIQQTLKQNKEMIAELQQKLNSSTLNANKLKDAIAKFEKMLNEKSSEIEALRASIEEKDIKIAELDDAVEGLKYENNEIMDQKQQVEEIAKNQDIQLNTAYYMYGTSKELKSYGVLSKGEVLQGTFNKNDFIKIDIRKTTVIPLESKSADILTNHPAGSYALLKDSNGKYTLKITDAAKFWGASKYLVVKVK